MKAVFIDSSKGGKPGTTWFPLIQSSNESIPPVKTGQVLVKMIGVALNHRDVFQRQNSYPKLSVSSPVGADGVGIVVGGSSKEAKTSLSKERRVLLTPGRGWESDERGPESTYGILGGQKGQIGTFTDFAVVEEHETVPCPSHLSDVEAAALPLAGLTAFRATFTKGQVGPGTNLLVTGIGGGVALFCLQFAVAAGANVWVTSSSDEKIAQAKKLGAKDGINYKTTQKWGKELALRIPKAFDVIIDSSGADIMSHVLPCIKTGGVVVAYGMTVKPQITFSMSAILANIEYRGSTMGSRKEFGDMVAFVDRHKIRPVIHTVYKGLDKTEEAMVEMRDGKQFGKIVLLLQHEAKNSKL